MKKMREDTKTSLLEKVCGFIVLFGLFGFVFGFLAVMSYEPPSSSKSIIKKSEKYENILRVFLHEKHRVGFFIKNRNTLINIYATDIRFIADVDPELPMWAIYYEKSENNWSRWFELDVHIHNVTEINGGHWDRGKNGKGNTVVIE